jgi:hypothetical protein
MSRKHLKFTIKEISFFIAQLCIIGWLVTYFLKKQEVVNSLGFATTKEQLFEFIKRENEFNNYMVLWMLGAVISGCVGILSVWRNRRNGSNIVNK